MSGVHFLIVKREAIYVKLDTPISFVVFLACSITHYGKYLCVGKLSPVTYIHMYKLVQTKALWNAL